jgi:hypothetical protein
MIRLALALLLIPIAAFAQSTENSSKINSYSTLQQTGQASSKLNTYSILGPSLSASSKIVTYAVVQAKQAGGFMQSFP